MADHAAWQQLNETYLARAFAWQRLRLTRFAARQQDSSFRQQDDASTFDAGADVAALAAELDAFEQQSPPPALIVLSRLFKLSRFERNLLLLCAGMELDPSIAALCARAQNDSHRAFPTFALALALFDEPA